MGNTSSSSVQQSSDMPRLCSRGCGFYGAAEYRGMCSKCFNDSEAPRACSRGCGFYGTAANWGMCSKCFQDHQNEMDRSEAAIKRTKVRFSDHESKIKKIRTKSETDEFSDAVRTELAFMERLQNSKKKKKNNLRY